MMITKNIIKAISVIILFYIAIESIGITCPIKFLTGISCAGCGMSRAFLAALKLDFVSAFHFHPLFWLVIPTVLLFVFRNKITFFKICFILIVAIFIITYLIRMFQPNDDIVVFEPQAGFIYRVIHKLIQ